MCNQFHYESAWIYNKVIMHNIQKICVLNIYVATTIYITKWGGG